MATSSPKSGYDAWVDQDHIHRSHPSSSALQLSNLTLHLKRAYLWLPYPSRIAGRTIASAMLTGHAHTAMAAQQLVFTAADSRWDAGKITWANQPTISGTNVFLTIPALAAGESFSVDLAALVQPVADGSRDNFGWRVASTSTAVQKLEAFDGPGLSWSLQIAFSEAPEVPTDLRPDGTVVGVPRPVVAVDFTDLGDDTPSISAIQVQVDTNNDGTSDVDSGQQATTAPTFDLATLLAFSAPSSGSSVHWRAKVWDEDGNPSPAFSAWAIYTYKPLPGVVIDSPAAGVLYDPTSDVLAHITGSTSLDAYRIWVRDADDPTSVRYDSGKVPATDPVNIAHALPLKYRGSRVFTDDQDYTIQLRVFDDQDREATPGVPAFVDAFATVHFDDDTALDPPSTYQVSQFNDTPFVRHTWTDVAAADAYVLSRDGAQVARLEPADVTVGSSTYSWVEVDAQPYVSHDYELRRLTVGTGRSEPLRQSIEVEAPGVWLIRDNGDYVCLLGDPPPSLQFRDRFVSYKPVYSSETIDVLSGFEGLDDDGFDHWIEDFYPGWPGGQTVKQSLRVLEAIKRNPSDPVQLVFAGFSKPVRLRNLTMVPHTDFVSRTNAYAVRFGAVQSGDFDFKVG